MRRAARLLTVSIVVVVVAVEPRVTLLLLFFRRQALLPDSPAVIAKSNQHPADILLSALYSNNHFTLKVPLLMRGRKFGRDDSRTRRTKQTRSQRTTNVTASRTAAAELKRCSLLLLRPEKEERKSHTMHTHTDKKEIR